MTKPYENKPFLTPLISFIDEHWEAFVSAYAALHIEDEAEAVYQWLKEQEGLK